MKAFSKIILFLFFAIISFKGFSQMNLSDIYQTGSTWDESYWLERGSGLTEKTDYQVKIEVDTTINTTIYKKLVLIKYRSNSFSNGMTTNTDNTIVNYGTIGGIRVSNNQVYFIRTKSLPSSLSPTIEFQHLTVNKFPLLSEITLYDFNLTQGSTLSWKQVNQSVLSVGSVMASNNQQLKTYTFHTFGIGMDETWREGIGSRQGFFGSYRNYNYINRFESNCFSSPTLTYPANCSIQLISGIKDASIDKSVTLYPNPVTSDIINVTITDVVKIQKIAIYNALGKVVFQKDYTTVPSQIKVDLNSGMYSVLLLTEKGEAIMKRIVKE